MNNTIKENKKVEVDWEEFSAFNTWKGKKIEALINPLRDMLKIYMPNTTIQVNKDYWRFVNND